MKSRITAAAVAVVSVVALASCSSAAGQPTSPDGDFQPSDVRWSCRSLPAAASDLSGRAIASRARGGERASPSPSRTARAAPAPSATPHFLGRTGNGNDLLATETALLALPLSERGRVRLHRLHADHEARRRLHAHGRATPTAPTRPAPTSSRRPKTERVVAGISGVTGLDNVVFTLTEQETGVEFDRVPFESGGELTAALLGGQVDIASLNPGEVIGQLESGDVKALCAYSEERYRLRGARRHPDGQGAGHRRRLRPVPRRPRPRRHRRCGAALLDRRPWRSRGRDRRVHGSTSRRTTCRPTPPPVTSSSTTSRATTS